MHVYRQKADGKSELALNIPEYRLLSRRPNEWQTSFEWRRMMTLHAALTGKALSIKVRGLNGRVRELIPVSPNNWTLEEVGRYKYIYRVIDKWGIIGEFEPQDVFVLEGLQWDMLKNMSAVHLARNAIGLAASTEKAQTSLNANSLKASGVYSVEGTLSPEQYKPLTAHLKTMQGAENAGMPLVLDRSAKWMQTTMNSVDAQHIETRRMQVEEICRAFNVFPIMVMHSDKSATFASSEAFFAAHLKHTLKPWHKAWRDRIDETLLDGSGPLYTKFDTRYLTEGSIADRAQWARAMVELGIYTRNELREEEGKDPIDGLDEPLQPLNMQSGQGNNDDEV
jgi:HK97 family phage portal protein